MLDIGVLAVQGSVVEHVRTLEKIEGVRVHQVKYKEQINDISGLIIPGGESTTIGKIIKEFGIYDLLVKKINNGMPVWGTCAGMILLAKKIEGEETSHLGVMDISVKRNAYGSQLDSFSTCAKVEGVSEEELPLVFIRAPWVESYWNDVEIMAVVNGKIVAVRQKNMFATSFHPELTDRLEFHKYFVEIVKGVAR